MRIAIFSWESLHSIPVGGLGVHVTELAAALQRIGNEVHVFTRIGNNQKVYEIIDGVHYHRCPFAWDTNNFVWEMDNMCKSMVYYFFEAEKEFGNFDVIHGHDWHVVNALDEIKKARGMRTVFTLHSTQYGREGNYLSEGIPRDIRNLEWFGTYVADRVIVCSNVMKYEIGWLYTTPEWKIRVIPNGINPNYFKLEVDPWQDVKRWYGIDVYDPLVMFLGRITYHKGPDLLLRAIPEILRDYPNAKFMFVGDGDMKSWLENITSELGISHATRFTGYVSDLDKEKFLKASDCVVIPSRNEPFGIVALEAWACERPIIVTNGTGAAEIVEHEINGLKVFHSPESIAWGVKYLFSSFERARMMGRNGRKTVEEKFSWDAIAKHVLNTFK